MQGFRIHQGGIDEAEDNYKIAQMRAEDNLQRRYQVLTKMAESARADARQLAEKLATRTKESAPVHPQPQPKPTAPQS